MSSAFGSLSPLSDDVYCLVLSYLHPKTIVTYGTSSHQRNGVYVPGNALRLCRHTYSNLSQNSAFWEYMCNLVACSSPITSTSTTRLEYSINTFGLLVFGVWTQLPSNAKEKDVHCTVQRVSLTQTVIERTNSFEWAFLTFPLDLRQVAGLQPFRIHVHSDVSLSREYFVIGVSACPDWGLFFSQMDSESAYFHIRWGKFQGYPANKESDTTATTATEGSDLAPDCDLILEVDTEEECLQVKVPGAPEPRVFLRGSYARSTPPNNPLKVFVGLGSV
eukprot:PhF_6_TR4747/c0_g1_i1/m.6559